MPCFGVASARNGAAPIGLTGGFFNPFGIDYATKGALRG